MTACIVSIGDELLQGAFVDTNAAWLASRLLSLGIETGAFICLPDERTGIARKIKQLSNEYSLILVTGGLGPTSDDVTREAASDAFHAPLELHAELVDEIRRKFLARGMDMPSPNRKQAEIPRGAEIIDNPLGTAFGFYFPRGDKLVAFLPGVPGEMKRMFDESLAELLKSRSGGDSERTHIELRSLHVAGIGESALEERLGELARKRSNPSLGFTCAPGLIRLQIKASGVGGRTAAVMADELEEALRARLGGAVVGAAGETPAETAVRRAVETGTTVAFLDGATGGEVVSRFTAASAGAADVFAGAVVERAVGRSGTWGDEFGRTAEKVRRRFSAGLCLALSVSGGDAVLLVSSARGAAWSRSVRLPAVERDRRTFIVNVSLCELCSALAT